MNNQKLFKDIETQIRNDYFQNKEELSKYLLRFKKLGNHNFLTEKEIEELLKLYDELNIKSEIPLEMNNYSNKNINNKNYIVSEKDDRILSTMGNSSDFIKEFKDTQNQILAYTSDGSVNSKEVFNKMANTQKEEITLMPIHEAINNSSIDQELLYKIRFFIKVRQINPYEYKIDIKNGLFYNEVTNEMYEVRKNENTNQYEIYVSGEIKYENTTNVENESETLQNDHYEERIHEAELEKTKVKVRKLTPPRNLNNAAFTKVSFLLINLISFIIISISVGVILLNK